jgi:hypothetical protein
MNTQHPTDTAVQLVPPSASDTYTLLLSKLVLSAISAKYMCVTIAKV